MLKAETRTHPDLSNYQELSDDLIKAQEMPIGPQRIYAILEASEALRRFIRRNYPPMAGRF